MNKPLVTIAIAAGLLATSAANAGDANLSQLLSASVATLPTAAESSPLHPATEAAISRQLANIDARMTATLATPTVAASAPAASATELASR